MNKNFKRSMITPKLLKACEEQVQKYFPGGKRMDDSCEFCKAVGDTGWDQNCHECPLGGGVVGDGACTFDETFIDQMDRGSATKKQRLARGNRLIEILDEHGITIYDKEVPDE